LALAGTLAATVMLAACADGADPSGDAGAAAETQQLETAAARLDSRAPSPGADDAAALEADVRGRLEER
jgi:hypothetical protein